MPFTSQKQRAFMYAKHPDIAKRWEKETPKGKLPTYHRAAKEGLTGRKHKKQGK